jgi:hypothetical protein
MNQLFPSESHPNRSGAKAWLIKMFTMMNYFSRDGNRLKVRENVFGRKGKAAKRVKWKR